MFIYAGIDEAGYGPMFGPLLVGRAVLCVDELSPQDEPPYLWQRLRKAVCRNLVGRKGRIAVNDSKKIYSPSSAAGLSHLERGVLAFTALAGHEPARLCDWLDLLGEDRHHSMDLPWYAPADDRPWCELPTTCTSGEIAVARSMLRSTAGRCGVSVLDLGAAVVYEDDFNHRVGRSRSKAAVNFDCVRGHLHAIWQRFGEHHPTVVVDRQGGRSQYGQLLARALPGAQVQEQSVSNTLSAYRLSDGQRAMTVQFMVGAEQRHMPVALASMISKYTRELLMARFQAYFQTLAPQVKPTAGYAQDASRFLSEISPLLPRFAIDRARLVRCC